MAALLALATFCGAVRGAELAVARAERIAVPAPSSQPAEAIRIGMSTALTGPNSDLGLTMKLGVEVCFENVNQQGGIGGRPIHLIAYDDGYEPERTVPNMRRLIDNDGVLAVVGNVGTPTAIAAVPIANAKKTLLYGAFTGARVLRRQPPDRYVINYRASYDEETSAMVRYLVDTVGVSVDEIAFFTQSDGYGDAGFAGGLAALRHHGLQSPGRVLHVRYARNTLDVEWALAQLLDAATPPKAVIMIGAYAPCARLIELARQHAFTAIFMNVSFVGSDSLADALGERGDGVIVTQVVDHFDSSAPGIEAYRRCLREYGGGAKPSHLSLEGYVAARLFVEGLRRIAGPISRESIIDALESIGDVDLGLGWPLSLSREDHQASHQVWFTRIENGVVVPFPSGPGMVPGGGTR